MDDIDRELKEIQLQRERLALEREIALKGAASAVGSVTKNVAEASKNVRGFLALWWKKILLIAILIATAGGALNRMLEYDRQQKRVAMEAKYARLDAASNAFAEQQCPEDKFQCSESDNAKLEACSEKTSFTERVICHDNFVGCRQYLQPIQRKGCLQIQKLNYIEANPLKED